MLNRRALIGASVLGSVGSIRALAQTSAQASSPAGAAALGPWSSLAISGARSILQVQETGRYLPVLEAAERIRQSVDADPFPLSTAAECFCMIGQERLAALCDDTYNRARRQHMPERRAAARAALADAKATPAIEAIVEHVRDRRIVIINEPHTTARARVFTLALAIRLRAEGFDWFAAETLRPPVAAFRSGVAFSRKMGWWTNEPVFAEVMRHIQALGYRTAAYDYDDPGTIQPADTPANVLAYRGGETSREAVPSDILALDCADPRPTLVLPAGPYTLKGERADGLIDLGAGVA